MEAANWHIFQILTKRHDRMSKLLAGPLRSFAMKPHIWWGVSVENRKHGLPRLRRLQQTHVAVRFLSIEPLLEDLGRIDLKGIAWAIVGGESGPGARPMKAEWVRSIQIQCEMDEVPFFFKQWGGKRKGVAGRVLDGRTHDGFPDLTPFNSENISSVANPGALEPGFVPVEALVVA
jgi:protein gp37